MPYNPCISRLYDSIIQKEKKGKQIVVIHTYIDAGIPPPNAPVTLTGGWIRNPVSGKPVNVKGKSGTTPLVDTGQLYNGFDWEITGK